MKKKILTAILFLAAASGWGLFAYYYAKHGPVTYYGKVYQRHAPEFSLVGHNGNRIGLDDLRNKIVLISWGYTNCPDVCPMTLSKLSKVMDLLEEDAEQVEVLFVTVDPERDTPERMKSYVPFFNEKFIGVTGTRAEIDRMASDYNVTIVKHEAVYGRSEKDTWDRYLMTHTNTVHLVDKDGNLLLSYPHYKLDVEGITSDIKKLLR